MGELRIATMALAVCGVGVRVFGVLLQGIAVLRFQDSNTSKFPDRRFSTNIVDFFSFSEVSLLDTPYHVHEYAVLPDIQYVVCTFVSASGMDIQEKDKNQSQK
ncbi:hypothetical protein Tco_0590344 [Tanacetum coccineum]